MIAPGDGSLIPLPGVTLGLYPTESDAVPTLECVSDGDGDCNFVVEDASNLIGTRPFVKQIAAPGGWFANPSLRTGPGSGSGSIDSPYVFQTPTLEAGSTYSSQSDFMFSSTLGSNYTAPSNGVCRTPESIRHCASRCGTGHRRRPRSLRLRRATNLPILKSATDQLVDAFVGTPSRMACFGFARYSPNQNATTNEIYPNHPERSRCRRRPERTNSSRCTRTGGWAAAPTGTRRCTGSPPGRPLRRRNRPHRRPPHPRGPAGPPVTPSGDGSNTHFADVEEAIFSANLLKERDEGRLVRYR
ncbi:hypothetical protein GS493_24860 [Rhodococcus hoagii]|nr:hypothetical protein [Prescottella equi]